MENKLKNHNNNPSTCIPNSHTAMHRESHTISKTKPKIRIIHIFAPEIIKTDAENFRELVQKLTGKPPTEEKKKYKKSRVVSGEGREQELSSRSSSCSGISSSEDCSRLKKNGEFFGLDMIRERVIKEEIGGGISSNDESNNIGGYLGGFSDLEGFIAEINGGGFPLLPMDGNHHLQGFEVEQSQLL